MPTSLQEMTTHARGLAEERQLRLYRRRSKRILRRLLKRFTRYAGVGRGRCMLELGDSDFCGVDFRMDSARSSLVRDLTKLEPGIVISWYLDCVTFIWLQP